MSRIIDYDRQREHLSLIGMAYSLNDAQECPRYLVARGLGGRKELLESPRRVLTTLGCTGPAQDVIITEMIPGKVNAMVCALAQVSRIWMPTFLAERLPDELRKVELWDLIDGLCTRF